MDKRALAADPEGVLRHVLQREWVELEWAELVARLSKLLDLEEKELLPRLERDDARGIVQEIGYLRGRSLELGSARQPTPIARAFVAEIRAHVQRAEHLGFRFPHT